MIYDMSRFEAFSAIWLMWNCGYISTVETNTQNKAIKTIFKIICDYMLPGLCRVSVWVKPGWYFSPGWSLIKIILHSCQLSKPTVAQVSFGVGIFRWEDAVVNHRNNRHTVECVLLSFLSKKLVSAKWRIEKGILVGPRLLKQGISRSCGECELFFQLKSLQKIYIET
jgi:hypothetical protein